ncbi:hypothetical protein HPB47_001274 [Ixodes persulcatus]|uniref:Uncharacterized protein n=1 Tax=Ixodes persulcatus TaxID=34615 RepID=A0AC60PPG5_IXOPE|nr:hypothetical protein HPB47_001274 [Ixodes persulcatus]
MPLPNVSQQKTTKKNGPAVDACWHVVVITAVVTFIGVSFERSMNYLYVAIMEEFGVDRKTASWPMSVMTSLGGVIGIFVGLLQKRYLITHITLVGSILTWVGVLTSGFATSTQWLILTMGVIHGIGSGIITVATKYFAMMYFDKHRGIAMGITSLGRTLAGFLFPQFLLYLRYTYSFRWSLFILGAISINITPLTYLLKEPHWCKRENQCGPTASIHTTSSGCTTELSIHQQERQRIQTPVQSLPEYSWTLSSMLCTPIFYVVVLSSAVTSAFEILFMNSMIDFCQDKGLTEDDAVWLASYFNLTDILGRLCIPLLADRRFLRRSTLLMLIQLLMASVVVSAPYATTYWSLAAIEAFAAILVSSGTVMHDVLAVDYFGLEKLSMVYGVTGVVRAPLQLCNPLILGLFRDRTGSYDDMFRFLAGILYFLCVLWLAVVCSERRNLACVSSFRRQDSCTPENGPKGIFPAANSESVNCPTASSSQILPERIVHGL